MKRIGKGFSLILIMTFICQNVVFCIPEGSSTLRVPVNGSRRMGDAIDSLVSNETVRKHISYKAWFISDEKEYFSDIIIEDIIEALVYAKEDGYGVFSNIENAMLPLISAIGYISENSFRHNNGDNLSLPIYARVFYDKGMLIMQILAGGMTELQVDKDDVFFVREGVPNQPISKSGKHFSGVGMPYIFEALSKLIGNLIDPKQDIALRWYHLTDNEALDFPAYFIHTYNPVVTEVNIPLVSREKQKKHLASEVKFNWASNMEDWARTQLSNAQKKGHFIEEIASKVLKRYQEEVSIDYVGISLLSKGRLHKYSYLVKIKLKTGELVTVVIKSYKFNRQNRFEKEIEALQFLGQGNVPEYYGSWVATGEDTNKNRRLDENNYMLFAESFEEGLTLEDYIKSIKGSPDYQEKVKRALILAIKKYASIQQKSAGRFQLVNVNPKNIIIYELPNGKLRAKIIDTGGQINKEDPARWLSDIKENLVRPITYPNIEIRYIISDKMIFSIVEYILGREFLVELAKKFKGIKLTYSKI